MRRRGAGFRVSSQAWEARMSLAPLPASSAGRGLVDPGHMVPEIHQVDLFFLHSQSRQGLVEFLVQECGSRSRRR